MWRLRVNALINCTGERIATQTEMASDLFLTPTNLQMDQTFQGEHKTRTALIETMRFKQTNKQKTTSCG